MSIKIDNSITSARADATYLRLDTTNDPLTNELKITPSSDTNAIDAQAHISLKVGQRMIFDGP